MKKSGSGTTPTHSYPLTYAIVIISVLTRRVTLTFSDGKPLPCLVLQFYHPVWVFVKHHPEVILTILRCEKHLVAYVLLDGTLCIVAHKIGKTILCLSRNGSDECGVHESRCRCMQSS
jgi:hypothetical protein